MARFTKKQIEILRKNPYVKKVGAIGISYTEEFKRRFWEMYTREHMMPREILELLGIDAEILGAARVRSIAHNFKLEYTKFGDFTDVRRSARAKQEEEFPPAKELNRLRMEVEYLRQEQEFIKKIISAGREVKSR